MSHGRDGNETFRRRGAHFLHGISYLALTAPLAAALPVVSAAALLAALAPQPASAECLPETAGADVVCATDDTDGFVFNTTGFNSITVDPGVTVSVPATSVAMEVDSVATRIVNNGTVRAGGVAYALGVQGTVPEVLNSATGTIEGAGGFIQLGAGDAIFTNRGTVTATLTRALSFDGGNQTLINSGTVTGLGTVDTVFLGAGDDIVELQPGSSITGPVQGGDDTDTLRFGGTGEGAFNLDGIDTGGGTQQYRSFETFGVIGGDWTFTGATPVAFTQTGGTVMGNAGFGDLTLDGGTIAPGNSIGTINVAGDIAFNPGSTYQVELNAQGQSDLIAATGTATIAATGTTLDIVAEPGSYPTTSPTYTILTATGGVAGQFATVQDNLPDLDFQAIYNATDVQLVYVASPNETSPKGIHPSALSGGARAGHIFAETVRRRGGLVASGGFPGGTGESRSLGYIAASTTADRPQVPVTANPVPRQWAVWGAGLGSTIDVDASGGAPGWDATTGGVAVGIERRALLFDLSSILGAAFGFTSSDVDSGASDANIESYHLGLYAASSAGALSLSGAIAYAFQDYDYTRVIPFGGGAATGIGAADGHALTTSFEAFYDLAKHHGRTEVGFGPLVTFDTVHAERDGFTETGAGILNLTVEDDDTSQFLTGLGVAGSLTRTVGTTLVTLDGRIAWQHVFGDRDVTSTATIPVAGATFVTTSAPIDRDRVALGLGAALEFSETVSAHLRYDSAFSGSTSDHRGSAGLTIRF